MTTALIGAGAVGSYYAARLALAGERVILIARPAAARTIAETGLRLEEDGETRTARVEATDDPSRVARADLVLVCVKAPDTAQAARDLAPHLAPGAVLVSLQNGLGNAETLATITGHPALPGLVYTALSLAAPGHVLHKGGGRVVIGAGPGAETAAARLTAAGIQAEVSAHATTALWTKLAVNCALNALSALTGRDYGTIAANPDTEPTLAAILDECRAVAAAEGLTLPSDLLAQVQTVMAAMPAQRSSTAQDLAAARKTEIAHLNGEIARRAARYGLEVPLNRALALMVALRER